MWVSRGFSSQRRSNCTLRPSHPQPINGGGNREEAPSVPCSGASAGGHLEPEAWPL